MRPSHFIIAAIAATGGWYAARLSPSRHAGDAAQGRKILFYQSPMHPWVKSDQPGQCTVCGMDLVPVFQGGAGFDKATPGIVMLATGSPNVIGVQTVEVRKPRHGGHELKSNDPEIGIAAPEGKPGKPLPPTRPYLYNVGKGVLMLSVAQGPDAYFEPYGVLRSTDAGKTWMPVKDLQFKTFAPQPHVRLADGDFLGVSDHLRPGDLGWQHARVTGPDDMTAMVRGFGVGRQLSHKTIVERQGIKGDDGWWRIHCFPSGESGWVEPPASLATGFKAPG